MIRRKRDASRSEFSHIDIPVPEELTLFPFQRAGVEYILQRKDVLLADEMGIGKSCQSIAVSNCIPEARRILIICPASLKIVWQREWKRFDVKGLSVGIAGTTFPTVDVCVINYDILKKHRISLRWAPFDLMIVDECHMLKSGRADRTKEVFGGIKRDSNRKIIERINPIEAHRRLFLTGTPMLNGKPQEIWNLIKAIDPEGLGADWFNYAKRYCELFEIERFNAAKGKKEHVGWKWDGAANLQELQGLMRQRFMIRRLKKDVLTELPPKTRQIIVLEAKKGLTKLLERETMVYGEYVKKNTEEQGPPAFTEMSKIRKEVALVKVPYIIEYLKELLNETNKVVVFAHHREAIKGIQDAFKDCSVTISSETSQKDRQIAIDRFQNEDGIRLFIGSIQAAGTGITLTAASVCVFAESDWVPANISQAEDRLHRIGQKENVLIQHIVLAGSLDERIIVTIIKKQEIIDQALDKETA